MIRYPRTDAQQAAVIKRRTWRGTQVMSGCRSGGMLEYLMYRILPEVLQLGSPATPTATARGNLQPLAGRGVSRKTAPKRPSPGGRRGTGGCSRGISRLQWRSRAVAKLSSSCNWAKISLPHHDIVPTAVQGTATEFRPVVHADGRHHRRIGAQVHIRRGVERCKTQAWVIELPLLCLAVQPPDPLQCAAVGKVADQLLN